MPIRTFRDTTGGEWRVWDVAPVGRVDVERRAGERRQPRTEPYAGPERRTGHDRRVRTPALLTPGLESGWLCFEGGEGSKRRLSPVPQGWADAPDEELEELVQRARPVARRLTAA